MSLLTRSPLLFLGGVSLLLFFLWLPGTRYPIQSDTIEYALLGESIWTEGRYAILGEIHTKRLPLQAGVSAPLVQLLGYQRGMQASSFLGGVGALVVTFFLIRRAFSPPAAILATLALVLHPGFVYLTMVGGTDPLFIALALGAVLAYLHAERNERWYLVAFVATGLACLTRYNGLPLFPLFFLCTLFPSRAFGRRSAHRSSPWFWGGLAAGVGLFSLWLLRNSLLLGSPFASAYVRELSTSAYPLPERFLVNVLYYLNPFHNIFPVLFLFACFGIVRCGKRQAFLLFAVLALVLVALPWWARGMRFVFAAYPLLLGFAAAGILDVLRSFKRHRCAIASVIVLAVLGTHAAAFCLYAYGACNAWADRRFGILPPLLGVSTEGFHTWDLARTYLNASAPEGSQILVGDRTEALVWTADGVFRPDLTVSEQPFTACPLYRITGFPDGDDKIVFTTEDAPQMSVVREECSEK